MFISSVSSGLITWSRYLTKNNSNDNDEPGGSTPVSVTNPIAIDPVALIRLKRTG